MMTLFNYSKMKKLKYFFENAKTGDHIATYRPQWWALLSHFIAFIQKDKKSHISAIIRVEENLRAQIKTYFIAEQNYPYPSCFVFAIQKKIDGSYEFLDKEFKCKYGYLIKLKKPLTNFEGFALFDIWQKKIESKTKYSFLIYPFTIDWFYFLSKKIFGHKIDKLLDKKSVCSTEALYNLCKARSWKIYDKYPTPSEFSKLEIFEQPNRQCF